MIKPVIAIGVVFLYAAVAPAQERTRFPPPTPVRVDPSGLKPLPELGHGEYQGSEGGLYPGGTNERPAAHERAGRALAEAVGPWDEEGRPDPDGRIVLLSVGMSNTTQEFSTFRRLANAAPEKNPRLVIVDGAQGAMTAEVIQTSEAGTRGAQYWRVVDDRLRAAGVTRAQVQVAWIKEADAGPTQGFPRYARKLQAELGRIVQLMRARFPNLKLAYLSSRIYGGYARTPLNPEPYAYESGFAVKWLIERQIEGAPELSYSDGKAPWLSWGPYLWAGGTAREDGGLQYDEGDFGPDGTHPSRTGREKVARLLSRFFTTDSTTKVWFLRH